MLKAGVMLANRYEIVGRIGAGGMADVYKAMDHKLNRYVAVKVMKPEFQGDSTFVSKFRREAQAAAGLANPNIVNVYDVGEDRGSYYIVMELVEGITLKEYIEKKGKLSVREATSIAIQVCMGLAAAHDQGIVHRDVKPQNIIISTDGKVKVTDFGIARAASSNTISANAMGSVHYSSPEQVRGGYSDSRSDIYSLGITLYEMVTGRVPFDGETTVAIAIKHLQDEMEPPTKYAPDLPHALEQIIYKCTQKSVDRRYQSMNEVISDLKRSLLEPAGNFVQLAPLTDQAQTVLISKKEQQEIRSAGKISAPTEGGQTFSSIEAAKRGRDDNDDEDDMMDDGEETASGLEKAVTIGSFIVCGLIIFILIFFIAKAAGLFGSSRRSTSGGASTQTTATSNAASTASASAASAASAAVSAADSEAASSAAQVVTTVSVPSILGLTEAEAQKIANDKSLGIKYQGEKFSDQAEGTIIEQDPQPGTQVEKNTEIYYYKSSGPETHAIPAVTGGSLNDAKSALEAANFTNVRIEKQNSESDPVGRVLGISPEEGSTVAVDTEIVLTVSIGSAYASTTRVTNYVGMPAEDAEYDAKQSGLLVSIEYSTSDEVGENQVISQDLEPDTSVAQGTDLTLVVNNAELAAAAQEAAAAREAAREAAAVQEPAATPDTASAAEQTPQSGAEPASGTWSTVASLLMPANYTGGPYRLTLVQTVDGAEQETVLDEQETSLAFPYTLEAQGAPGVADGLVYLYEKNEDGDYVALATWPVTFAESET